MIGFGELRKLSAQWRVDLAAVERAYALDWLLKGIFDHATLARALVLRGSAALRYAHCADYPVAEDPEFLMIEPLPAATRGALADALAAAAAASGLQFLLTDFAGGSAKIEFTGPLGRRSAAQPRIALSIVAGQTRLAPVRVPLIHPFSDLCAATVSAIALEEFAAEQLARLAQTPRARDVFDLWFALTRAHARIDAARTRAAVGKIAQTLHVTPPRAGAPFSPAHRAALERTWDNALRRVSGHPAFAQVERDLIDGIEFYFDR